MFARTERLLLRPGWVEDAPALSGAINDRTISANLAAGRWPNGHADAESWLSRVQDRLLPKLLIFSRTMEAPKLVGGAGLHRTGDGPVELDVWIAPEARCAGFAAEAAHAVIDIAHTLGIGRLSACVFSENTAAIRLLVKLGFAPLERLSRRSSDGDVLIPATRFMRRLAVQAGGSTPLLAA